MDAVTNLENAREALRAVDLRTLPRGGSAREDVKEARRLVDNALALTKVNLAVA